jgi:hypothetical protein
VAEGKARRPLRHPRVDDGGGSWVDYAAVSGSGDGRLLRMHDEDQWRGKEWHEEQPTQRKDDGNGDLLPRMGWRLQAVALRFDERKQWRRLARRNSGARLASQ